MNINEEIQKATDKIIAEKLPTMVEEKVTSMLNSVIQDVFSSYGTLAKDIKVKIEEKLDVNLQEFDLIDYNALIGKTINDNLLDQVNLQPILDITQNTLGFINQKTITLDEVAELFRKAAMEENNEYEGEITFLTKEHIDYKWLTVYADIEPDKSEYECDFEFSISTKDNRDGLIFTFKTKQWYSGERREISPAKMVQLRGLEAQIFRLYSAQVKITNYDEEVSNYWSREEY